MYPSLNVLIGGGTGFVGRHLVNNLRNSGAKVNIISRQQNKVNDNISWDTIRNEGLPEGTNAVVNVAGRNILDPVPWTSSYRREVYESRIGTNQILSKAISLAKVKPKCFVTISGVGYYEPSSTKVYTEDWSQSESVKNPNECYLMKLASDWEKSANSNSQTTDGVRRVIIRSGVVIGPDGGIFKNFQQPISSLSIGMSFGDGKQWFPWIHVEDLANLFKFSITNEHVTGVINGVAPDLVRNADFARAFSETYNKRFILPAPAFIAKLMFGSERSDIVLKGQCVKSRAELLGFRYEYPKIADACKASRVKAGG